MIKLVVGLGNPGQKFSKTRHNVGFLLLDELAKDAGVTFVEHVKFYGYLAEVNNKYGQKVYLLKPSTFMNRSGQAVAALVAYYKILPEEVLVLHDELDFEVGMLRLKSSGGHGGHNGLRDIISSLGAKDFIRLRVGIDRPIAGKDVADYVLSDFSKKDMRLMFDIFQCFIDCFPLFFTDGYDAVVGLLHSK